MKWLMLLVTIVAASFAIERSYAQTDTTRHSWEYVSLFYITNDEGQHIVVTDDTAWNALFECMNWCEGGSIVSYMNLIGAGGWEAFSLEQTDGDVGSVVMVYFKRQSE
jgi:hypothetical protein